VNLASQSSQMRSPETNPWLPTARKGV
jgi:hypothetical protein